MEQKSKQTKKRIKIKLFSVKGEEIDQISLPEKIFGQNLNEILISQAVRVYLANQRRACAKAKTRSEVSGSRRKIWRQKGTGRARHGDRYAPIFVGGGVAHGPTGDQNWRLKLPRKMRQKALFSSLSNRLKQKKIIAVADLRKIKPKTKAAALFLKKVLGNDWKKVLIITGKEKNDAIIRSFRNLPSSNVCRFDNLNVYLILNSEWLIFEQESIKALENWSKNGSK